MEQTYTLPEPADGDPFAVFSTLMEELCEKHPVFPEPARPKRQTIKLEGVFSGFDSVEHTVNALNAINKFPQVV